MSTNWSEMSVGELRRELSSARTTVTELREKEEQAFADVDAAIDSAMESSRAQSENPSNEEFAMERRRREANALKLKYEISIAESNKKQVEIRERIEALKAGSSGNSNN
ncbi:uncharacterized protein L201_006333 [Kwoniella dendrophila CBS 6074]|uniref:GDP/GTP exchange factor Sec2 N-terminal domain-containing protein n=1 Tax=Kwoniella dendrophila CBS 6074 TaxID=1295534 RepID=A0AAX4K2Q6_9TREE